MNFLKKIFGQRAKSESKSALEKADSKKQTPVNESPEFLTHIRAIDEEFDFLIKEYGFKISLNDWVSRAFTTVFEKNNIQVIIIFESGSLPIVKIKNTTFPYDESQRIFNSDLVEDFNKQIREIRQIRHKRHDPKQKKFMDEWLNNDNLDLSELNKDYLDVGRQEHIKYLRESAKTVRENLMVGKGVIKTPYNKR